MIKVLCEHCGVILHVPDEYLGKSGQCNHCKGQITVTDSTTTEADAPRRSKHSPEWYAERRTHLEFCKSHYAEACERFGTAPKGLRGECVTKKAIDAKGNAVLQKALCEQAVAMKADMPWAYERLAVLYGKEGKKLEAFDVCAQFFLDPRRWRVPNWSASSLKLLDRMERLGKAFLE